MASIKDIAQMFFDACETGNGWQACKDYCHPDATFAAQAEALADIDTLADYTEWMKGLLAALPDGHYEIHSFAMDEDRDKVCVYAVFKGTNTGEGGPVAPTGREIVADYVYVMQFDEGRIRHLTKIWNDGFSMEQLGWM